MPHITVVIPTRNRLQTLRHTLQTVLDQDYEDLTILVSDNQSSDGTADFVQSQRDTRLTYRRTGAPLSMAGNYEFALAAVVRRDGWVTLIGDDDGLVPGGIARAAELLTRTGVRALRSMPCSYSWPGLTGLPYGRLGVNLSRRVETRQGREWLRRVVKARASYHELPMLYQGGFVHWSLFDAIKARGGTFFRSCIPDVYSGIAIASTIDDYAFTEEPIAINGLSAKSIGMSQIRDGNRQGSEANRFRAENTIAFHPDVPLREDGDYPVGQAIIYESFLQSGFLRDGPPMTNHREQLELALGSMLDEGARPLVENWARAFAALHGLDLRRAALSARRLRPELKLRRARQLLRNATRIYSDGSPERPISNVREAAQRASEILDERSRPSMLAHLAKKAGARCADWARSNLRGTPPP